jgi:regulator of sirC expression with transglutaminase-like and TPR domain
MPTADRFSAIVAGDDDAIDLAEACLLIAADEYPSLDIAHHLGKLDELAGTLRSRLRPDIGTTDSILALNRYLFDELGFHGASDNYYDPRNSFLNDVLERREGIPITLSIVYIEVGRRLGLRLEGVSFPGHFLVRCPVHDGTVILDPYHKGVSLGLSDLQRRFAAVQGGTLPAKSVVAAMLGAASPKQIVARVLRNLKGIYLHFKQWPQALAASSRVLQVDPGSAAEWRERGELHHRLECFRAALADFQRYLELAPDAEDADMLHARIVDLQRSASRLN